MIESINMILINQRRKYHIFLSLYNYFPNSGYIQSTVFCEEYEQMNKADVMWFSQTERSYINGNYYRMYNTSCEHNNNSIIIIIVA